MSSSNSSRSSGSIKVDDWTNTLYFTPYAEYPDTSPIEVSDGKLKEYFLKYKLNEETIIEVTIFKRNLFSLIPKFAGLWHEFLVVKSTNWFWSFEKDSKGICVQRGKNFGTIKNSYRGEKRTGTIEPEGRPSQKGINNETIQNIINWNYEKDEVNNEYHVSKSNCHLFASLLFEAIARQESRHL